MPQLDVLDVKNNKVGDVDADPAVFDAKVNNHLVKQYVVLQRATRRLGTASTKSNYGQLSGSGKKPWRQKEQVGRESGRQDRLFGVVV